MSSTTDHTPVTLKDIASPNMTPEADKLVSEALERSAEVMNKIAPTERDIDVLLVEFEQNCMRIREAPIDGEILAVSITHQQDLAKQAIQAHYEKLITSAKPDILNAYEETRKIGCVDDDAQKGYILAISQYEANLRDKLK